MSAFGAYAWVDLDPGLFNNLDFEGANIWRLETDQIVPAPNTQARFGIQAFGLGTSLFAGQDSFNGDVAFASVNELPAVVVVVPEPSTFALAGLTLAMLLGFRNKRAR